MATFSLEVSYGQVAVFDARLPNPFNDWSDDHVAQGFSWRPGSVAFATVDSAGPLAVQVASHADRAGAAGDALRVIVVPFSVPTHGEIEVASIAASAPLRLPPGEYELTFEHGRHTNGKMWATLTFRAVVSPVQPRIVRLDSALSPRATLTMTARPA